MGEINKCACNVRAARGFTCTSAQVRITVLSITRTEKSVATNFISFNYSRIVPSGNWIMLCHKIILCVVSIRLSHPSHPAGMGHQQSCHLQWINVFQFRNNMRHHILTTVLATKTPSNRKYARTRPACSLLSHCNAKQTDVGLHMRCFCLYFVSIPTNVEWMASVHHLFECKRSSTNKYPIANVCVIYALKIYYWNK